MILVKSGKMVQEAEDIIMTKTKDKVVIKIPKGNYLEGIKYKISKPYKIYDTLDELVEEKNLQSTHKNILEIMIALTILMIIGHTVAILSTYKTVILDKSALEFNFSNIPSWASKSFVIAVSEEYIVIFGIIILIFGLYLWEYKQIKRKRTTQIFYLLISSIIILTLLTFCISTTVDGVGDLIAQYAISIKVPVYSHPNATSCYYESISSNEYVVYINQSYLSNYKGNITFEPSLLSNLSKCQNFNK